jgi:putative transposase
MLFGERGVPSFVPSDDRPELVTRFLMRVLAIHRLACRDTDPVSPWQNGCVERFNGSLRDECLDMETFHGWDHAQALLRLYWRHYNARWPHRALGYPAPAEFAAKWKTKSAGTVPALVSVG